VTQIAALASILIMMSGFGTFLRFARLSHWHLHRDHIPTLPVRSVISRMMATPLPRSCAPTDSSVSRVGWRIGVYPSGGPPGSVTGGQEHAWLGVVARLSKIAAGELGNQPSVDTRPAFRACTWHQGFSAVPPR
jgi:hypothetical protein